MPLRCRMMSLMVADWGSIVPSTASIWALLSGSLGKQTPLPVMNAAISGSFRGDFLEECRGEVGDAGPPHQIVDFELDAEVVLQFRAEVEQHQGIQAK